MSKWFSFFLLAMSLVPGSAFAQERQESRGEVGAAYWASSGNILWSFYNGDPQLGNPTSTHDWNTLHSITIEAFGRVNLPFHLFAKGTYGQGPILNGIMRDVDYLPNNAPLYGDTTSVRVDGDSDYALVDVGVAGHVTRNWELGIFGGYQHWAGRNTEYGMYDNLAHADRAPYHDTAVIAYQPVWHMPRVGAESRLGREDKVSVSLEVARVIKATLHNDDSHFLRTSLADLGPLPNLVSTSTDARGTEAEAKLGVRLPKKVNVAVGVRYWSAETTSGVVLYNPELVLKAGIQPRSQLLDFKQEKLGLTVSLSKSF